MLSTPAPTLVTFFYKMSDFFNLSSIETMYRTDLDRDKNGISNLDYRALTEDDRKFFDLLLRRASTECFKTLQPLVKGIFEGYGYNKLPSKTVAAVNALEYPEKDFYLTTLDAGILTVGNLTVAAKDKVYFDGSVWVKDNATEVTYIFYNLQLPWNFDLNNKFGLDDKIREYISMYIVKEWFKRQRFDTMLIEAEFELVETELARLINYRMTFNRVPRTF